MFNQTQYTDYNNLTNQTVEIPGNLSISKKDENCLDVSFPSTTSVKFCERKEMLSFVVTLGDGYKNNTKGLLGTWNDNLDDDFTLPDGTVLPPSSTSKAIHFDFGVKCEYICSNCTYVCNPYISWQNYHLTKVCVINNWFMLCVRTSSYGCTWEVWIAREKRKSCSRRSREQF